METLFLLSTLPSVRDGSTYADGPAVVEDADTLGLPLPAPVPPQLLLLALREREVLLNHAGHLLSQGLLLPSGEDSALGLSVDCLLPVELLVFD